MTAPMSTSATAPPLVLSAPPSAVRRWSAWLASFVGFPLGGLAALALGGVDDPATAALGGAAAGLVVGAAQGLALRGSLPGILRSWTVLTGAGLAGGLVAGSALVDYGTGATDLVVQGLCSGVAVGAAQALVLGPRVGAVRAALWLATVTALWPLGWTVTRLAGVSVEDQFAVFGATGALTYAALSGAVLVLLLRGRSVSS